MSHDGGAVAQLGARLDGIEEAVGSNPIGSTKKSSCISALRKVLTVNLQYRFDLNSLDSKINPENRHSAIEFGRSVGAEFSWDGKEITDPCHS